jgi:RecJ-like exonuclease
VEIIYIDHHPLPEKVKTKDIPASTVIHKTKGCSAELTYLHFEEHLSWHHKFLAAVGAVGDYEIDSLFAQEVMRDFDGRSIAFQAAIIVQALGEIPTENDIQMKKSMIERMSMGVLPSELTDLVEKAIIGSRVEAHVRNYVQNNVESNKQIGYILDIPTGGGFKGKGALFAATAADKPVGICGNSIYDKISISIRRRNHNVDLNKAARNAGKAVGGSGGGHESAAGATIERDQWKKFLELMDFEVQKQLS